jgi:RNA polymerase sigma-70 factor (ECF subfamily)
MSDGGDSDLGRTDWLLDQAREGDASARQMLLERLRPRIVLWVAARLSPELRARLEPEDVAQEVLLSLHRSLDSFDGEEIGRFYAWTFTIAENRIRDLVDHHGALKRRPVPGPAVSQTTPGTAAVRAEELERVRSALEQLGEDHRRVIQLRQLEGKSVPETAEILERSDNAVRVLHCRALKALRDLLRE